MEMKMEMEMEMEMEMDMEKTGKWSNFLSITSPSPLGTFRLVALFSVLRISI